MPNHVSHKLTFDVNESERVFAAVCVDGLIDFSTLISPPPQIYQGNLSKEDDEDFKCNWSTWNRDNWGTKWNAYHGSCAVIDGKAVIAFDTAWSIPYPVLSAFANKFRIPFEHRYFDEGSNFWGIEEWGYDKFDSEHSQIVRTTKRKSSEDDRKALCIELKGYDPDVNDDD